MRHFRYRKVTPEIEEEMRRLRRMGLSYPKIARIFGVDYKTVVYHLDEGQRKKALDQARMFLARKGKGKRTRSEREKRYMREYYKDRYHNDPEFRRKVIRANKGFKFREG